MKHLFVLFSFLISFNIGFSQVEYNALSVENFQKSINHANVQVLDVRTADEYRSGHLKKSLQADWYKQQQFKERTSNLDKSKPVYVYCLTGVRSEAAVKQLKRVGFLNVFDLKGGLTAWKLANKPVEGTVNVKQITLEEYKTAVGTKETVLVDFGAEWCPPCKKMEPIVAQLKMIASAKYTVINIDAATQTEILKQMKVEALPVFIVYKNGKEMWRKQGVATFDELKNKLL